MAQGEGVRHGPIPAHAGEPTKRLLRRFLAWAYPRSRGGTQIKSRLPRLRRGLSPLTRGNRGSPGQVVARAGPIPAHAGEPGNQNCQGPGVWAYPRSRGGTGRVASLPSCAGGLSPLTRGNHQMTKMDDLPDGPIPAHAGEPGFRSNRRRAVRAYPRSRGGTLAKPPSIRIAKGLSPLTRGNRAPRRGAYRLCGPIPAHAGEPLVSNSLKRKRKH